MLIDNHGRRIDYVRLAVTDKCNLRCFYCMPENGIDFVKKDKLLSYEEIQRILNILAKEGVSKVRITGGEPFLRKDVMSLIKDISGIHGLEKIAITTNGTLTKQYLDELIDLGIHSFNLSIDSIDPKRFKEITRRDSFDAVWDCYRTMIEKQCEVKINAVVMKDKNIEDIIPLVALSQKQEVSIRFIEEMPFNGIGSNYLGLEWDYKKILGHIENVYGRVEKLEDPKGSTSLNYKVRGFKGSFGIIPAYSRTFCGSCNRLRITPTGGIKTCLYDDGVFNIRDLIRAGADDQQLVTAIKEAIGHRAKDGFEAENNRSNNNQVSESMATIGG